MAATEKVCANPPTPQAAWVHQSTPLEGLAASPPWWLCLLGELCFLCAFWFVTHQWYSSYLVLEVLQSEPLRLAPYRLETTKNERKNGALALRGQNLRWINDNQSICDIHDRLSWEGRVAGVGLHVGGDFPLLRVTMEQQKNQRKWCLGLGLRGLGGRDFVAKDNNYPTVSICGRGWMRDDTPWCMGGGGG